MAKKPKRNDPCHCGSGRKYKNCCIDKDESTLISKLGIVGLAIALILGVWFLGTALSGGDNQPNCPSDTTWSEDHQHCH